MRRVKGRLAALLLCALVTAGAAAEVCAQGYRVRVYNPGNHSRTRSSMSGRAAARAALKKKRQKRRAAAARRRAARPAFN